MAADWEPCTEHAACCHFSASCWVLPFLIVRNGGCAVLRPRHPRYFIQKKKQISSLRDSREVPFKCHHQRGFRVEDGSKFRQPSTESTEGGYTSSHILGSQKLVFWREKKPNFGANGNDIYLLSTRAGDLFRARERKGRLSFPCGPVS